MTEIGKHKLVLRVVCKRETLGRYTRDYTFPSVRSGGTPQNLFRIPNSIMKRSLRSLLKISIKKAVLY